MRLQENHRRGIEPIQVETVPAARYLAGGGGANVMP